MSSVWHTSIVIVLISLIKVQVYCNCFAPLTSPLTTSAAALSTPIALPLTNGNVDPQPRYQLIPAGLYSDGIRRFIRPFPLRPPRRKQQSTVIQQVTVNQNGGIGGFKRPFASPFLRPHLYGFHRPHLFGGFRTHSNEEYNSNESLIEANKCPLQYIFSCQPTVSNVPCTNCT